ncbi:hypothetical protein BH23BAC2_BH23BAC2_17020 [soil metagenome]
MNWPHAKKLEKKLANNDFSNKTGYLYLITFLIMLSFLLNFPELHAGNQTFGLVINLLICGWGIGRTFEINQSTGNNDFLKRFISLSFLSGLKLSVALLAFVFVLKTIKYIAGFISPDYFDGPLLAAVPQPILGAGASIVFFVILINSFKRLNEDEEEGAQAKA